MKVEFVQDMQKKYMVISIEQGTVFGYQQKMLLHNHIKGLLEVELRCVDQDEKLFYDVTSKHSLEMAYRSNQFRLDDVSIWFSGIVGVILDARQYLLKENNFVLMPQTVYLEEDNVSLCYVEGYEKGVRQQLLEIAEFIMQHVDYQDERGVMLIYGLYKELREDDCSFEKVLDIIEHFNKKETAQYMRHEEKVEEKAIEKKVDDDNEDLYRVNSFELDSSQEWNLNSNQKGIGRVTIPTNLSSNLCLVFIGGIDLVAFIVAFILGIFQTPITKQINWTRIAIALILLAALDGYLYKVFINKANTVKRSSFYDEDEDESDEEGTIILNISTSTCTLTPMNREYPIISIRQFPFVIGKENGFESVYISKKHALLSRIGQKIVIKDLDSTNGTFLNGELLEGQKEYEVSNGDSIILAKEEYIIHFE